MSTLPPLPPGLPPAHSSPTPITMTNPTTLPNSGPSSGSSPPSPGASPSHPSSSGSLASRLVTGLSGVKTTVTSFFKSRLSSTSSKPFVSTAPLPTHHHSVGYTHNVLPQTQSSAPSFPSILPRAPSSPPLSSSPPPPSISSTPSVASIPLPPTTVVPMSSPHTPPSATIKSLQDLAKDGNADKLTSTQSTLKKICDGITTLPDVVMDSIRVKPRLAQNDNGFELGTFSIPSQPGTVFYKIKVAYNVSFQSGKPPGQTILTPIEREIFTTATTPEEAILAASEFTKMVAGLAIPTESRVEDPKDALHAKAFSFQFSYNPAGKPTSLKSVNGIDGQQKSTQLKIKPEDPSKAKYHYYYLNNQLEKTNDPKKLEQVKLAGEMIYSSEAEALLEARYTFADAGLYHLQEKDSLVKQVKETYQEIAKKEKEIEKIREQLRREPLAKWCSHHKNEGRLTLDKYLLKVAESNVPLTSVKGEYLTPAMVDYIEKNRLLNSENQKNKTKLNVIKQLERIRDKWKKISSSPFKNLTTQEKQFLERRLDNIAKHSSDPANKKIEIYKLGTADQIALCLDNQKESQHLQQQQVDGLKKEIARLHESIKQEQAPFLTKFRHFQKLNHDLNVQIKKLKTLKSHADSILHSKGSSEDSFIKAKAVNKAISSKLEKAQNLFKKNQDMIKKLEDFFKSTDMSEEGLGGNISVSEIMPGSLPTQNFGKRIMIPGDGNCLFYAIGVGLRKKLEKDESVQQKLGWKQDVTDLQEHFDFTEGLKEFHQLLEEPAKTLRKQATDWLTKHKSEQDIEVALVAGIHDDIDATKKSIERLQGEKTKLEKEEEELKLEKSQKSTDPERNKIDLLIQEIGERIKKNEQEQEKLKKQMALEEEFLKNHQDYIDKTKRSQTYATGAHIMALSREYSVPIRIIRCYGTDTQHVDDTFVPAGSDKSKIITIAYVDGNHYDYIDG